MSHDVGLVLLGMASGIVVAAFGGLLTLVGNSVIQDRQVRADRRIAQDKAAIEFRQSQLQPVVVLTRDLERHLNFRRWELAFQEMQSRGLPPHVFPDVPREMMTPAAWNSLKEVMSKGRFDHKWRDELAAESTTVAFRIDDVSLRTELVLLAMAVTGEGELDFDDIEVRLARLHRGLETHATKVDATGT